MAIYLVHRPQAGLDQFGTLDLTGQFTPIGTIDPNLGILGNLCVSGDNLYAVDGTTLYQVHPGSVINGVVTLTPIGPAGVPTVEMIRLGSTPAGLYAVGNDGNLYTIDPMSGAAERGGATTLAATSIDGISTGSYELYMSAQASVNGLLQENLYAVNVSTGVATLVGKIGDSTMGMGGGLRQVTQLMFINPTLYGTDFGQKLVTINTSSGLGTEGPMLKYANNSPLFRVLGLAMAPQASGGGWTDLDKPAVPAITNSDGVLTVKDYPDAAERSYVFVDGSDGHLWVNWWNYGAWLWSDLGTPTGVIVVGAVGVTTVMDGPGASQRPYAFVQGSDGQLWVNWWDGQNWIWDKCAPMGPVIAGVLGVTTVKDYPDAAQRPYVFVQGGDGHLWVNWWNYGAWLWSDLGTPTGVTVAGAVGVTTVMDGPGASQRPYAFVQGSDGHLWMNWWNYGAWLWSDLGTPAGVTVVGAIGVTTVKDYPDAAQRPYVFVQGGDGHLWMNWWNYGAWLWSDLGTPTGVTVVGAVGVTTVMDGPGASQRPYAFLNASDGALWADWWDGQAWRWSNYGTPAGVGLADPIGVTAVRKSPASTQYPDISIQVFIQGTDGDLWMAVIDPSH